MLQSTMAPKIVLPLLFAVVLAVLLGNAAAEVVSGLVSETTSILKARHLDCTSC